jgi:hypothetical protein
MVDYLKDNPDYKKSGERLVKIIQVAIILIIWCDYFYQTGPNKCATNELFPDTKKINNQPVT